MSYSSAEQHGALSRVLSNPASRAPDDIRRLASIAVALEAVPDPEIDPSFVARLEARIMSEEVNTYPALSLVSSFNRGSDGTNAEPVTKVPHTASVIWLPRRRLVVRKALVGAVAAILLVALPLVASASALPGTPFYGLHATLERLERAAADGPVQKGFVDLKHGARRLDEVKELFALRSTPLVPQTLERMNDALRTGTNLILRHATDPETLTRLARALGSSTGKLSTLLKSAPASIKPSIIGSLASGNALRRVVMTALTGSDAPDGARGSSAHPRAPRIDIGIAAAPALTMVAPRAFAKESTDPPVDTIQDRQPAPTDSSTSAPSEKKEGVEGHETRAPCVTRFYAGPEHHRTDDACSTVIREIKQVPGL
ncbi:MAG: hypothetical protein NVSMB57_04010 [Actinomycetota bacterium]